MKIEMKFLLDEFEDKAKIYQLLNFSNMAMVLSNLDDHLRSKLRYADLPAEEADIYENVRENLLNLCEEEGFSVFKLWE